MKLMIASDLHGSDYYTAQMVEAFEKEGAGKLLLLGDILYHGPRNDLPREYAPKKVIERLNALAGRMVSVRGNCEAEVDQMVLHFPVLSDSCLLFCKGRTIFATHGHLFHEGNLPPLAKGDILLHGHTHVPALEVRENYIYMNPGSVSIPKENSPHSYMILEDGVFTWKTLSGEVYRTFSPKGENE